MKRLKKLYKTLKTFFSKEWVLITGIILIAFVVRLYKIDNPIADWHSWRQADTASVTRIYVEEGINLFWPRYHDISSIQTGIFNPQGLRFVEFPIYNALHALLVNALGTFSLEVWGRLASVFSALISTYLMFLIGKRFLGKWGGVASASFFAIMPFNIYFTRVILPEPMTVMFGLTAIWFFVRFIDSQSKFSLYISGIAFAIAALIKPFIFFYSVPLFYLVFKKYGFKETFRNSKIFIPLLIYASIVLIPFFAWRVYINQYPQGIPHFWWAFNGDRIRFKPAFWRWIFSERIGNLLLGVWGLIPFSYALLTKIKGKFSYFTHFFFFGMLLYVTTFATASVRHDYYQTLVVPAVCLVLAQGVVGMWETDKFNKLFARVLVAFSVFVMLMTTATQVKAFYQINHPEILEAGRVADETLPKDALIIAPYNGDTAFLYQTKRKGWPVVDTSIDELKERGATYFVSVNFADPDTIKLMDEYKAVKRTGQYAIIDLTERQE